DTGEAAPVGEMNEVGAIEADLLRRATLTRRATRADLSRQRKRRFAFTGAARYFTSNVAFVAGLPSMLICTSYLPAGKPSGLLMWNVVVAVPAAVDTDSVFWLTGWPW